jgi:PAS domain S-box-containing protein
MNDPRVDILIVDDRPENLLALEAILEPLHQRVVRASSGEEALRKLLTRDFAVILLDVQMPGMNGFETARLVKSRERTKHIPIIFLTAISKEEQYVFEGYSVGAVDYLFKPFQPEILRTKVAAFVDLHQRQRQLTAREARLRESEKRELELKHMREMLASEQRYSEIVRSAMDAIVIFDERNIIRSFNATAERMFCCTAEEALGQPVTRFFPADVSAGTVEEICRLAHRSDDDDATCGTEQPQRGNVASFTAVRLDGERFPVEASVSCLDNVADPPSDVGLDEAATTAPSGVAAGGRRYTLIVRDVSLRVRQEEALREQAVSLANTMSELKALNEELNQRQIDLEKAMTARSRFYASMSHELRTPINAVLGYSTLLLENIYGPLNEKQQEGIERTQKAARHLLELVNDVLDLSKIEAGKIDLRPQPVSFPSLVEDLFVTVRPLADQYGSTLALQLDGDPIRIVSDPRRVRQILLNLLSNAIKFGGGKPVRVNIGRRDDGGVRVSVIDEGAGIASDDQERIFQEFVQLGKTQLQEGTGLGLPISRRLAELLRGSLVVRSEIGKGSTFELSLPATVDARTSRAVEQEVAQRASDERRLDGDADAKRQRQEPSRIAS